MGETVSYSNKNNPNSISGMKNNLIQLTKMNKTTSDHNLLLLNEPEIAGDIKSFHVDVNISNIKEPNSMPKKMINSSKNTTAAA